MRFKRCILVLAVFMFFSMAVHAQGYYSSTHLTQEQIDRLKQVKMLLNGVDKESLWQTIRVLEKTKHPQLNLVMKEAMAKTFVDIANQEGVQGQKKREWLYSMVCLNMAYLQFGGTKGKIGSTTELNRLIRQKLIQYLPSDISNQPGFIYSLE